MLVLDATAVVDLVRGLPGATPVRVALAEHGAVAHAPELVVPEVVNALHRWARGAEDRSGLAQAALVDFLDLPIKRHPHTGLAGRMWELRNAMSAYDASYLPLAEALSEQDATLVTADGRFARAARTFGTVSVVLAR